MRRVAVLLLVAVLAGCSGPGGEDEPEAVDRTTTEAADPDDEAPPRSYEELLERLPPFDEPASPEVAAYREAAIGTFFDRCVTPTDGADEAAFVRANSAVLDRLPIYPGAQLDHESTSESLDGNGCPEGLGPPTSFRTSRTYRLPRGSEPAQMIRFYERRLLGWARSFGGSGCEQGFRRGEQYVYVRACAETLSLEATALPDWEPPPPPDLPPRPDVGDYPAATDTYDRPEPEGYEVEPGETCERTSDGDEASLLPPAPGVRAEVRNEPLHGYERHVRVEWWFDEIHGDCPPVEVHLTLDSTDPSLPPLSIPYDVRERSGIAQIPLLEHMRNVRTLRASAESIDGRRSRSVAILVRR